MAHARYMVRKGLRFFSPLVAMPRRLIVGVLAVLLGIVQPLNSSAQSVETLRFVNDALKAGPGSFVTFMNKYGKARLEGKSHEEARGMVAGGLIGGLIGKEIAKSQGEGVVGTAIMMGMSAALGAGVGRAYGLYQSNTQLDHLYSEWQNERTPLATALHERLEVCRQEADLSWCATQPEIVTLKQRIAEVNHRYCELAAPHFHNPKGGMFRCTAGRTK